MNPNSQYTLGQAADLYYADNDIAKKKYLSSWLVTARFVWKEIFRNTLWSTQTVWKTMQDGEPHPYVEVPSDSERVFSVEVEDDCGKLVPLFYNNRINVVKKPTVKKCGCTVCECGGLCEDVNSLVYTTKLIFTINNIEYYEKMWTKTCSNGDVILYTETPVKKYDSLIGDGGDFNDDYNNDYLIGAAPFSDYEIVYVTEQKKICSLEVLPCGCVVDTPENEETFSQYCGCFMPPCNKKKKRCDDFLANPNNNDRGEIKISECGNKIYYVPSKHWRSVSKKKYPDFLLVSYQVNPEMAGQQMLVPEYALQCLFDGVDFYKKKRKDKYSVADKLAAKWQYEDSRSKVILYLSPLQLEELSSIQDAKIAW